jgi:predicted dehydrogenase
VFGIGRFGRIHAEELDRLGLLHSVVDTDETVSVDSEGVETLHRDLTSRVDPPEIPAPNEPYTCDRLPSDDQLLETQVWDIATPSHTHFELLLAGVAHDRRLLVEKPPTRDVDRLQYVVEQQTTGPVGVNYVERAHPVVRAAGDALDAAGVSPTRSVHRRSKDIRDPVEQLLAAGDLDTAPLFTLGDLVHDLSEVDEFRQRRATGLAASDWTVSSASVTRWRDLPNPIPSATDVAASFELRCADGFVADIGGSFAERERRYFVVGDDDYAVFGTTLSRDHIEPVAAIVEGTQRVTALFERLQTDPVFDDEDVRELLDEFGATVLRDEMNDHVPARAWTDGEPQYGEAPLVNVFQNLCDATDVTDLFCPISDTLPYQAAVETVYDDCGVTIPRR